jgi:hypothetical protein
MPLMLPSESDVEDCEEPSNGNDMAYKNAGKGKRLERSELFAYQLFVYVITEKFSASSFYPGRGDNTHNTHLPARLDHRNYAFHTPEVDDDGSETEEDPMEDVAVKLPPNKFSESVAIEVSLPFPFFFRRPTWAGEACSCRPWQRCSACPVHRPTSCSLSVFFWGGGLCERGMQLPTSSAAQFTLRLSLPFFFSGGRLGQAKHAVADPGSAALLA